MNRTQYFIGGPLDFTKRVTTSTAIIEESEFQFFESKIVGNRQTSENKPSVYKMLSTGPDASGKGTIEIYVDSTMG